MRTDRGVKTYLGVVALLVVAAAVSFAAGRYARFAPSVDLSPEFADAAPNWTHLPDCSPPTNEERAKYERALDVLQTFDRRDYLLHVASRYFAQSQYRWAGTSDSERICPPLDLLADVAEVTLEKDFFIPGRPLRGYRLALARTLGPRDPRIIEAVAETAFFPHPVGNDAPIQGRDVRTLARIILAEFGPSAAHWSDRAFEAMSTDDRLGTTAAQAAVALGHPQALERASDLLRTLLDQHPEDPIPLRAVDRVRDLVNAIAWAGPDAEAHATNLIGLLDRKVESATTSFGILQVTPTGVCRALQRIGGAQADSELTSEPCGSYLERTYGAAY